MSNLHIPRYSRRPLVKAATVYLYPDEPAEHVLARVEEVHRDPNEFQAPTYTILLLSGAHAGEVQEALEIGLASLGERI